jgi:hypothetical protein
MSKENLEKSNNEKFKFGLVDNSTTYTGKDAEGFYSTLLLTGDSRKMFRLMPNVKDKAKIASLDMGDFFQADACELTESGSYTLDDKTIEVCDLGFKIPFCAKDWETNYLSETLKPGSNAEENFPNGVIDYIFNQIALKGSALLENLTFQGSTTASPPDLCDGLQKQWLADAAVIDVAVDGTKINAKGTVLGELERMYLAIPQTLDKSKLMWGVTQVTYDAFKLALLATNPALVMANGGDIAVSYLGIPLTVCRGLSAQKSFIADPQNLIYATDLLSDEDYITFEAKPNTNKKKYYAMGSLKFGVSYEKGAEIVYYN